MFGKKATPIAVICITLCADDEVKIELEAIGGLGLGQWGTVVVTTAVLSTKTKAGNLCLYYNIII